MIKKVLRSAEPPKSGIPGNAEGSEIHGSYSSLEDGDADVSPCNFTTARFPLSPELRRHPFDSLHSECLSPCNFVAHEMEDPLAETQTEDLSL